jgi:hypothetical protein
MGMSAAVVYESMFGNTKSIAEAIADGLAGVFSPSEAVALPVSAASPELLADLDLLVVGGPTHMRRMTSRRTRELRAAGSRVGPSAGTVVEEWEMAAVTGVREWLSTLSTVPGFRAAAFDTRLSYMPAVGAGPLIALGLRCRGYKVDPVPRCFFVQSAHGPLKEGEAERARAWGAALGRQLLA